MKETDPKGLIWGDSVHMNCPEEAKAQTESESVVVRGQRGGGGGEGWGVTANGMGCFWVMNTF